MNTRSRVFHIVRIAHYAHVRTCAAGGALRHLFDGFSMLVRYRITGGQVWGSQRYVDSIAYRAYKETGGVRMVRGGSAAKLWHRSHGLGRVYEGAMGGGGRGAERRVHSQAGRLPWRYTPIEQAWG